jgi:hypothetical protein
MLLSCKRPTFSVSWRRDIGAMNSVRSMEQSINFLLKSTLAPEALSHSKLSESRLSLAPVLEALLSPGVVHCAYPAAQVQNARLHSQSRCWAHGAPMNLARARHLNAVGSRYRRPTTRSRTCWRGASCTVCSSCSVICQSKTTVRFQSHSDIGITLGEPPSAHDSRSGSQAAVSSRHPIANRCLPSYAFHCDADPTIWPATDSPKWTGTGIEHFGLVPVGTAERTQRPGLRPRHTRSLGRRRKNTTSSSQHAL